jgi:hypothetical protein
MLTNNERQHTLIMKGNIHWQTKLTSICLEGHLVLQSRFALGGHRSIVRTFHGRQGLSLGQAISQGLLQVMVLYTKRKVQLISLKTI